jgi:hydrogenase maturation protein HypF
MLSAIRISVRGRVQGVGFRPFVFSLATKYLMTGTVQNNMDGVKIHLEGSEEKILLFINELKSRAPRLAKIEKVITETAEVKHFEEFTIIPSERVGTSDLIIPIDSAICNECLQEMNDRDNFRFNYPFINCTQCGPRYTIINELPYDRPFTSMAGFHMCPECNVEYEDPTNRRHHAQPIACPHCGPTVKLFTSLGEEVEDGDPMETVVSLLEKGHIIAIKGLGGFHLCCDAKNQEAVSKLRMRKNRPNRPLAVMASSIEEILSFANLDNEEMLMLESPEAPIVVLRKKDLHMPCEAVAPGMRTVGVMLPYTPLHHLLFKNSKVQCLIMTSANPSGLPILYKDDEAFSYLGGIADYYLLHNREILHPVDDSVVQINDHQIDFFRRSRGFVPDPLPAKTDVTGIVAFGGQQKTTFTIGRNQQIFVGPHIGDLENMETIEHYKRELDHLLKWIDIPKNMAVIDAHPGYRVRKLAMEYSFEQVIEVQHHHAHMASCMADNHLDGDVYGIILDGTGYGTDNHVWGFEILYGNYCEFKRLGHLQYTPLPGGEKAIKEPWRNAVAMLLTLLGEKGESYAKQLFPERTKDISILKTMIENKINIIEAGTCGRLFDAVSSICGICQVSSYDGEAAIQLAESAEHGNHVETYPFELNNTGTLISFQFANMLEAIVQDVLNGVHLAVISSRFHETIVSALSTAMLALKIQFPQNTDRIVLSGGSMHNRYLREQLTSKLTSFGFKVYNHSSIPCNDGGLSYGQLMVAAAKRRNETCVLAYQQK